MVAPGIPTNNLNRSDENPSKSFVGIHLSGPNAKKTAIVVLGFSQNKAKFISLYEKIGSIGTLFSDERVIDILRQVDGVQNVTVDCPTSEPPCVKCERFQCPGVLRCEDPAVGMMLAVGQQSQKKGRHKRPPLNPQNLRLWDIMYGRNQEFKNLEPTYSANLAPLVIRAKTLQRRLRSLDQNLNLQETNVSFVLQQLEGILVGEDWAKQYRNFEQGLKVRKTILSELTQKSSESLCPEELRIQMSDPQITSIVRSTEAFHAFIAACMGLWSFRSLTRSRPDFFNEEGWVETLASRFTSPKIYEQ